ncbi:Beta-galactosidase 16 [Vigna angularis]|uniref:beta-galactosidase n=1 Tax=Phaseolus angularis TaxID=3914 RepID=A0A8T0KPK1_PHAAN|nr:Beta-galactosidase 16 [Vigna angularis]
MVKVWWWRRCFPLAFILTAFIGGAYGGNVTYDGRSLVIDGEHRILFSGSIHYPRSTPQDKEIRGRRTVLVLVLIVVLLGVYQFGYMIFRVSYSDLTMSNSRFATKIVNVMKSANLYVSQGGPIILSQIENEYGNVEGAFHEKGLSYIRWAAQMAVGLQTGVPWVMCKQDNAPDPVINTCNGMQCGTTFKGPNSPNKPSLWTENWTSFYQVFGGVPYIRSAEDIAYNVALFIAKRGSYVNYYMAYVFKSSSTECAAFLENNEDRTVTVQLQNISYQLSPKSISILPDCKNVAFNTAKVRTQNDRSMKSYLRFNSAEKWKVYKEAIPSFDDTSLRANTLLDQISTAKDTSDYMWYTFRFNDNSPNAQSIISAYSQGHVLHTFINGNLVGSAHGSHRNASFVMENKLNLIKGMNNISFLSATVGLPNSGAYLEHKVAGLNRVKVQGRDFTNQAWGYQVGLLGEKLQIYTASGSSKVQWERFQSSTKPLTWYKTTFDAPEGNDPIVLNLDSMGKGYTWINGQGIGRYWVSFQTPQGTPSQKWYHIPRSLLKSTGNLLVLLEEETGNPLAITLDTVYITSQ